MTQSLQDPVIKIPDQPNYSERSNST